MVAAEHIDDVPQLFNFIEVSRHRIGGWFHHVPGFHGAGYHLAASASASFRHALFLSLGGLKEYSGPVLSQRRPRGPRRSRGNHRSALTFSPKGRRHPSGADNKNGGHGSSRAQGEAARG